MYGVFLVLCLLFSTGWRMSITFVKYKGRNHCVVGQVSYPEGQRVLTAKATLAACDFCTCADVLDFRLE